MAEEQIDKYRGCFIGLACGDAFGAPLEGGFLERLLWRFIGKDPSGRRRFTDDTQMSIDLARSVLQNGEIDQQSLALHFAGNYCWTRGYGPGAAHTLYLIKKGRPWAEANRARFPDGSFGNGAAMRAPIVALLFNGDLAAIKRAVQQSAEITHAHPDAITGALLIALAVQCSLTNQSLQATQTILCENCDGDNFRNRLEQAFIWLESDYHPTVAELGKNLGNGIAATKSCVTAIYLALANLSQPWESLIEQVGALGGDVDTIGAMAGAIWGAANGIDKIPQKLYSQVEMYEEIIDLADRIFAFSTKAQ